MEVDNQNNAMEVDEQSVVRIAKKSGLGTLKRKKLIFYVCMMALPIIQFTFFYVYVNINSFVLAFRKLDTVNGGYYFVGFQNFKDILDPVQSGIYGLGRMVLNSVEVSALMFVFGSIGAILFSYYIYKKNFGSKLFKTVLYMPHIVSTVIFVILFQFFVDNAVPEFYNLLTGKEMMPLTGNPKTAKATVMIFNVWISFGTQVLLYDSAMSSISESIIESGQLDGISPLRELIAIVIPLIWTTFETFLLMRIMGIFTEQMSLYSFFGAFADPEYETIGYFIYKSVQGGVASPTKYPIYAAFGLVLTCIAVPLTLFVRRLMDKFGPSTN